MSHFCTLSFQLKCWKKIEIKIPWSTTFCFKHCFYFYVCYLNESLCELLPWEDSARHQYTSYEQRHFCPQWAKSILQKIDIHYTCRQKGSLLAGNKTLQKTKEEAKICNAPTTSFFFFFLKKWDDHQWAMLPIPSLYPKMHFAKFEVQYLQINTSNFNEVAYLNKLF